MTEEKKKDKSKKDIEWEPERSVTTDVQKGDKIQWEPKKTVMKTVELEKKRETKNETKKG